MKFGGATILGAVLLGTMSVRFSDEDIEESNATTGSVRVQFFVMSKCHDAIFCEAELLPALKDLNSDTALQVKASGNPVDVSMNYITLPNASQQQGSACLHGEPECIGNQQQLCAKAITKVRNEPNKFLDFVLCQIKEEYKSVYGIRLMTYLQTDFDSEKSHVDRSVQLASKEVPDNGKFCAEKVGIDWEELENCVKENGPKYLGDSGLESKAQGVHTSCTVKVNDRLFCVHNRDWQECPGCTSEDKAACLKETVKGIIES